VCQKGCFVCVGVGRLALLCGARRGRGGVCTTCCFTALHDAWALDRQIVHRKWLAANSPKAEPKH
jgi:hypothetical protein